MGSPPGVMRRFVGVYKLEFLAPDVLGNLAADAHMDSLPYCIFLLWERDFLLHPLGEAHFQAWFVNLVSLLRCKCWRNASFTDSGFI